MKIGKRTKKKFKERKIYWDVKNSRDGFNNSLDTWEEQINELENMAEETI